MKKKVLNVLISVFTKGEKFEKLVRLLDKLGVNIYSTGGTADFIEKLGITVKRVEDLTGFPEMLEGRVKTLHPKVFGGLLARSTKVEDMATLEKHGMPKFDAVIVDLYPFEKTVAETTDADAIIEKIDVGGIALIRAAAKNFSDMYTVPSEEFYDEFATLLQSNDGHTELADREKSARNGFTVTSTYDSAIRGWFDAQLAD